MMPSLRTSRRPLAPRPVRLEVEMLEPRAVPAAGPRIVPEIEANDTLDRAQDIGERTAARDVALVGSIATGTDVDWYRWTLAQPSRVQLTLLSDGALLSLYNSDPEFDTDPLRAFGHGLLAQTDDSIDRLLVAGTYYVAVSGAGNQAFHPFLADSGYPGDTDAYAFLLEATDLGLQPTDGPILLASSPAAGSILPSAPLDIRLSFSAALDPSTLSPDDNLRVTFSTDDIFGNEDDTIVALAEYRVSTAAKELQLLPYRTLAPGYYEVFLAGDVNGPVPVLTSLEGLPLGLDVNHEFGQDVRFTFQIGGIEGGTAADDQPAMAHDLGDVTVGQLAQAWGQIGDDPAYDPDSAELFLTNRSADVDLYQFRLTGQGRYAFTAEVFAGRLGSRLNPGISLFRRDGDTGELILVAANDSTLNDQLATNGLVPLFTDAALFASLDAGEYFVAVTSGDNTPELGLGRLPGVDGIFDVAQPHSAYAGDTVGRYLLNLAVGSDDVAPGVVAVCPANGSVLPGPPTHFTVTFTEEVNLRELAYRAFQQPDELAFNPVWIESAGGERYYPRLAAYDTTTHEARFLLLDRLPTGSYQLHLSGELGLTDLAGNPLTANPPAEAVLEVVVAFTVEAADAVPNPWPSQGPNDTAQQPQELGILFPRELQAVVSLERTASATAADDADWYRLTVLQQQFYLVVLNGAGLPAGTALTLADGAGNPVDFAANAAGTALQAFLQPGTYVVGVVGWTSAEAADVGYQLTIALGGAGDNAPPLTVGPAPAIRLRLAGGPTPAPPAPLRVVVPTGQGNNAALVSGIAGPTTINGIAPGGALLGLGAGPAGGLRESAAATVRLPTGLLPSLILIQTSGYFDPETEASRALPFAGVSRELARTLATPVQGALQGLQGAVDAFFAQFAEWFAAPDKTQSEAEPASDAAALPASVEPAATEPTHWTWLCGLAVTGAAALCVPVPRRTTMLPPPAA